MRNILTVDDTCILSANKRVSATRYPEKIKEIFRFNSPNQGFFLKHTNLCQIMNHDAFIRVQSNLNFVHKYHILSALIIPRRREGQQHSRNAPRGRPQGVTALR